MLADRLFRFEGEKDGSAILIDMQRICMGPFIIKLPIVKQMYRLHKSFLYTIMRLPAITVFSSKSIAFVDAEYLVSRQLMHSSLFFSERTH